MAYTPAQLKALEAFERTKQYTRTFRLGESSGRHGVYVGRKFFEDPSEALRYTERIGLTSFASFDPSASILDMPRTGASFYGGMEDLMRKFNATTPGTTVDRATYNIRNARMLNEVLRELTDEKGVQRGFMIPDAEGVMTVLRFYQGGTELPSSTIQATLANSFKFDLGPEPAQSKLWKRLHQMINEEAYGTNLAESIRVKEYNPALAFADLGLTSDQYKIGFDGQVIGNPAFLKKMADSIDRRADAMQKALEAISDPVARQPHIADITKIRAKASKLRQGAKTGLSGESFRALGLEDLEGKEIQGLVKGDINFPSQKQYEAFARDATKRGRFGFRSEKEALAADLITTETKKEFSRVGKGVGYATTRINSLNPIARQEIQTIMTVGAPLHDVDLLRNATETYYGGLLKEARETGRIPQSYIDNLRPILEQDAPMHGQSMEAFLKARARAERFVTAYDSGIPLSGELAREFFSGVTKSLRHPKNKADPYFVRPATLRGHIRNAELMDVFGMIDEMPDEGSMMFEHEQIIARAKDIHAQYHPQGGMDLDDLLNAHLRRQGLSDDLIAIITRNPSGIGEGSVMGFKLGNQVEALDVLSISDPASREQASELSSMYRKRNREIDALSSAIARGDKEAHEIQQMRTRMADLMESRRILEHRAGEIVNQFIPRLEGPIDQIVPPLTDEMRDGAPLPRKPTGFVDFDTWAEGRDMSVYEGINRAKATEQAAIDRAIAQLKLIPGTVEGEGLSRHATNLAGQGILGRYANAEMLVASLQHQLTALGLDDVAIPLTGQENIIDAAVQGGGLDLSKADQRIYAMLDQAAKAVAGHDLQVSKHFFRSRYTKEIGGSIVPKGGDARYFLERVAAYNPNFSPENWESITTEEHVVDRLAQVYDETAEHIADLSKASRDAMLVPQAIMKDFYSYEEQMEAKRLSEIYTTSRAYFKEEAKRTIPDLMGFEVAAKIKGDEGRAAAKNVLLQELEKHFEDGEFGPKAQRIVEAMMRHHQRRTAGLFSDGALTDIERIVHNRAFARDDEFIGRTQTRIDALLSQTGKTQKQEEELFRLQSSLEGLRINSEKTITRETLERYGVFEQEISDELSHLISTRVEPSPIPGSARQMRMAAASDAAASVVSNYKRITKDGLLDFARKPTIRNALIGGAGLTAFSVLYQKMKDRSPEDLQGPPLLPGGSAYEDYPTNFPAPVDPRPMSNTQSGMSYRIVADGSFDPDQLQSEIESLTGGFVTANYYEGQSGRVPRPRGIAFSSAQRIRDMMENM